MHTPSPTTRTFVFPQVREILWQGKPMTSRPTQAQLVTASLIARPDAHGDRAKKTR